MNKELAMLTGSCFRLTQVIVLETGLIERLLNYSSAILYLNTREKKITASGEKSSKAQKVPKRERFWEKLLSSLSKSQ